MDYGVFDYSDHADSSLLLQNYYSKALSKDPNWEYDRFPRDFVFSKNFEGAPSNPRASRMDKLHTEAFQTNKIRNIEKVYHGSDEMPELEERRILSRTKSLDKIYSPPVSSDSPCKCGALSHYLENTNISNMIDELKKKNDILTFILLFIIVYCLIQFFGKGVSITVQPPSTTVESPQT